MGRSSWSTRSQATYASPWAADRGSYGLPGIPIRSPANNGTLSWSFLVQPTESGRAAKVQAIAILDEQQKRFLAPLTSAQRQQLGALLKRLQRPPEPDATGRGGLP